MRLDKLYIDIPAISENTVGSYAVSAAVAGIATVTRLEMDPHMAGVQFITFYPAVMVTTLLSGFRAGLACLAFSILATGFLFFRRVGRFGLRSGWMFSGYPCLL